MNSKSLLACVIASALLTLTVPSAHAASTTDNLLTAELVNESGIDELVGVNANRVAILRAQILLDRAHFSPGEIDASYGGNMGKAISAYQASNALAVSGTGPRQDEDSFRSRTGREDGLGSDRGHRQCQQWQAHQKTGQFRLEHQKELRIRGQFRRELINLIQIRRIFVPYG